ncbi:hypothetical protein LX32DRAFT_648791 [Colletotrichum zoysiae]|uniref:Uncharacterized protein n=1 Tax=Colletotrichum zoysiae TaxID=1216348 RepID=A0AAD9HS21_9PEZI|nr:hypothetical protein LX32DRAFT_648791 [Colletotrichum zoysiae]
MYGEGDDDDDSNSNSDGDNEGDSGPGDDSGLLEWRRRQRPETTSKVAVVNFQMPAPLGEGEGINLSRLKGTIYGAQTISCWGEDLSDKELRSRSSSEADARE